MKSAVDRERRPLVESRELGNMDAVETATYSIDGRRSCPTDDLVFGCSRHEGYLDYRPLHLLQHDGAWDPPWIGPRECGLHLTDRLVGTPGKSADTSIARRS